jgi:hypothetical protein
MPRHAETALRRGVTRLIVSPGDRVRLVMGDHMLLLALAAAVTAPLPRDRANWLSDNDYPRAAFNAGEQGRVTVVLSVDETGEPQVCTVRATTAPASLAKLSCNLLIQRARFEPARDDRGKAVAGEFVQGVQWSLPSPRVLGDSGYVTKFEISEGGAVASCAVQGVGGQPLDMQTASMCDQLKSSETLSMFLKKPLQRIRSVELRFLLSVDRAGSLITISPSPYDFHRVISTAEFEFLEGGSASKCTTTSAEVVDGKPVDACQMLGLKNISMPNRRELSRTTQGRAVFDAVGYYR